jgi:hypothetical protein
MELGRCQHGQLQHLPAATAAAAVVVRPSRRRVLNEGLASAATATQALHLTYEADLFARYEVPAWASGRPSRVVVSSAAGLIITVTDGEGEVIEREAGCATGPPGPVAHDSGGSFCATTTSAGLDGADLIRRW